MCIVIFSNGFAVSEFPVKRIPKIISLLLNSNFINYVDFVSYLLQF